MVKGVMFGDMVVVLGVECMEDEGCPVGVWGKASITRGALLAKAISGKKNTKNSKHVNTCTKGKSGHSHRCHRNT